MGAKARASKQLPQIKKRLVQERFQWHFDRAEFQTASLLDPAFALYAAPGLDPGGLCVLDPQQEIAPAAQKYSACLQQRRFDDLRHIRT